MNRKTNVPVSESKVPAIATAGATSKNKRKRRGVAEGESVASAAATSVASTTAAAGAASRGTTTADASSGEKGHNLEQQVAKYFDQFQAKPKGTREEWAELIQIGDQIKLILREKSMRLCEETGSTQPLAEGSSDEFETNWNQLIGRCSRLGVNCDTITNKSNDHEKYAFFDAFMDDVLRKTNEEILRAKNKLKEYATRSNKTETGSAKTQLNCEDYAELMQGVHIQSPSRERQEIDEDDGKEVGQWWKEKTPKGDRLQRFSNFWDGLVLESRKFSSSEYQKNKNLMSQRVSNTVSKIVDWDNCGSMQFNCREGRTNFGGFYFPSCTALEKEGVQPLIAALQQALCRIDPDEDNENEDKPTGRPSSSTRFEQRRERYMPATRERPKRFVDIESLPPNAFNPYLLDHEMKLVEEVKNIRRETRGAEALHKEVTFQMLSHHGKRCLVAFDVADVGIDADSVGLIITPVYVQVIRLRLQNMGTKGVTVSFDRTAMLPLVHQEAFEAFVTDANDRLFLQPKLYTPTDTNSTSGAQSGVTADFNNDGDREPPKGLKILWELMHCSDEDLGVLFFNGGDSDQQATYIDHVTAETNKNIDHYIGSGSQGIVYGLADEENKTFVVKSSVVGETRYIKREIEALHQLSKGASKEEAKYVTKLESFGCVEYKIRSASVKVPAILISPRGRPADSYLASLSLGEKTMVLILLWSNGQAALTYGHNKGVFHLDVCPRNFVFCDQRNNFVLIDWGCSFCDRQEKPKGFRGSLPFAHAKVHNLPNKQLWKPETSFDKASLLFTVVALQQGSSNPFKGFERRIDKESDSSPFTERRGTTRQSLNRLLDQWLGADMHGSFLEGTTKGSIRLYGHDVSAIDPKEKKKEKKRIMNMVGKDLSDA